jgi:hypothetical protein
MNAAPPATAIPANPSADAYGSGVASVTTAATSTSGTVILLRTAMVTLLIALVLAWCLVLTRGMKIPALVALFSNNDKLLSAHLDFLMMTMLLFGFYCTRIPLPAFTVWPMAIGSITNPTVFLIQSMGPHSHLTEFRVFVMTSLVITTVGYATGAIHVLRSTLADRAK